MNLRWVGHPQGPEVALQYSTPGSSPSSTDNFDAWSRSSTGPCWVVLGLEPVLLLPGPLFFLACSTVSCSGQVVLSKI